MLSAALALGVNTAEQPDNDMEKPWKCIVFTIWIQMPEGLKPVYCLLDSGAEGNFIQQRWAKQYLPDIDSTAQQVKAINNTTVTSYDGWELQLIIGDANSALCTHTEIAESVNIIEYDFILGFP